VNVHRGLPRGVLTRRADERGVVAVWAATMLVMLLGMAAFAIDVSYWHLEKTREQRAADASSLAGAVKWPDDPTNANAAALAIANGNGFSAASISTFGANDACSIPVGQTVGICAGPGAQPYQYKVKVVRRVNNLFGGVFGIGKTNVSATASAEYLRPLSMGSPSNQFGNDPDANPNSTTYPNFWANIAGGGSTKLNGDAYAANDCPSNTDGCSGVGFGLNSDYKTGPTGYVYSVTALSGGPISLEAFDPGFVGVGDYCTANASLGPASLLHNVPFYPEGATNVADIARRYLPVTVQSNQSDPGYHYCNGDIQFGSGPLPTTTFTVLKATVPGVVGSATQVCAPITIPGFNGDLADYLGNGKTVAGAPGPLATYFRQWMSLCQVNAAAGDQFFIEVSTDARSTGHNRFALRAVIPNSNTPAMANIAGNAYMGIYANVGSRLTEFYLARIPSAAAGHTLVLNFYDIGDASSPGTLKVVPPPDSNVGPSFPGCKWTGSSGSALNTPLQPWGTPGDLPSCLITGVNAGGVWNGQWITVTIPMAANYSCNDGDPNGCWVKIDYNFQGGVDDTTSWNAFLLGDPVRLTQ
jgi:hypothetical protein